MSAILYFLFLFSALLMPWWFVVPFGIVVATLPGGGPVAVLGGVLLDALYGAPIELLGGLAHLYTLTFVGIVLFITLISERVVD